MGISPGDKVSYYFECFDNDGVHGSKSARTGVMTYEMPSEKQLENQVAMNSKSILADLEKALKEAKDLKNKIKELQDKLTPILTSSAGASGDTGGMPPGGFPAGFDPSAFTSAAQPPPSAPTSGPSIEEVD